MILTSRRQQRVLAEMRAALQGSDASLVARYGIFTRLAGDEEIPGHERVPGRRARAAAWLGRAPALLVRCLIRRPDGRRRKLLSGALVIPALMAALLCVALLAGGHSAPACSSRTTAVAEQGRPAQSRLSWSTPACPAHPVSPLAGGR